MTDSPDTELRLLCKAIMEMVAMRADEERVGVDDHDRVDEWADALQDAVVDGLEAAYARSA